MMPLADIERGIEAVDASRGKDAAAELLTLAESVLEHWVMAKALEPTDEKREGFRMLALHRQGTKGDPSFNACRETCREIAYHYNLVTMQEDDAAESTNRVEMMKLVSNHLYLFVSGKLEVAGLGEFCCSSKPIRLGDEYEQQRLKGT
jgi:hypothetical protein